jgi:PhoH-like ATPase
MKKQPKSRTQRKAPSQEQLYLLDTNVLVHDPNALFAFENSHVVLPISVLEELDQFKKEGTDRGRSTRQVIRSLDELRQLGDLGQGVELPNNSILSVVFVPAIDLEELTKEMPLELKGGDNNIILTAVVLQRRGHSVYFISKDLNARVKANVFGIYSEDYTKESILENEIYRGFQTVEVPAVELKKDSPKILDELKDSLIPNEFVLLQSQHNPHNYNIVRYLGPTQGFRPLLTTPTNWPIHARNPQQAMALDLLLDPEVQFVSLIGPAGTGKTFLALLAGLHKVLVEQAYEKMLISRPVIPLGKDIGYLPGTIEEKLHSWMLPIYDNLELIIHEINAYKKHPIITDTSEYFGERRQENRHQQEGRNRQDKYYKKKKKHHASPQQAQQQPPPPDRTKEALRSVHDMIRSGKISLEAITYMRGRSIPYQYILIDEAQNLSRHEVKTLVTRAGEGSKIVLTGDPYQIDSPYLDFSSNGLVLATEKFKGNSLFGTVFLDVSERSTLSQVASELL